MKRGLGLEGGRRSGPETHNHHKVAVWTMLGDCLVRMHEIADGSVDMVLCDLPYGTTACEWDSVVPLEPLWAEYRRVTKPNAAIVLTASQPFTSVLAVSNLPMFRYEWVWDKGRGIGHLNATIMPLKQHESVLVFYRNRPTYHPQMGKGRKYHIKKDESAALGGVYGKHHRSEVNNVGERYPTSVLRFNRDGRQRKHTTQKPIALMAYLIKTYTNPGETVLDNTMGSGSTGVACLRTGRAFIGIERNPEYYKTACERMGVDAEL